MSIAQHFVACEGDAYPCAAEAQNMAGDARAHAEFTCDTTNLPWLVFRAAHRAAYLSGLPARSRALLSALARTVDAKRPYAAIYARRELLTGRAMQSMRTFYRGLDDLEAAGLITRAPQQRYVEAGLFGRAYLHLTQTAAKLLGLADEQAPANHPVEAGKEQDDGQGDSLSQRSASVADGAIYKNLFPSSSQKRQPGQLPADLERLRALGFHVFLIFKLMKEAGQHGKRLSDVVEATWTHLKKAKAPINYLRALLRSTADFRYQVHARRQQSAQADQAIHEAEVVRETLLRCAGRVFFDHAGERRIAIGSDGLTITVHDYREAAPRAATAALAPVFVQALEAGRIRPATATAEEGFVTRRLQFQPPRHASAPALSLGAPECVSRPRISHHLPQLKDVLSRSRAAALDAGCAQ